MSHWCYVRLTSRLKTSRGHKMLVKIEDPIVVHNLRTLCCAQLEDPIVVHNLRTLFLCTTWGPYVVHNLRTLLLCTTWGPYVVHNLRTLLLCTTWGPYVVHNLRTLLLYTTWGPYVVHNLRTLLLYTTWGPYVVHNFSLEYTCCGCTNLHLLGNREDSDIIGWGPGGVGDHIGDQQSDISLLRCLQSNVNTPVRG